MRYLPQNIYLQITIILLIIVIIIFCCFKYLCHPNNRFIQQRNIQIVITDNDNVPN